ncbi:Protein AEXR-1 [Aphelenchoides avenae]|nr:Protein AEXR-1 [Aphelenchus avenae]
MTLSDLLLTAYAYPVAALLQLRPSLQSVNLCASKQICKWLGQALSGAVAALWVSKFAYITGRCTTTFANEGLFPFLALIDIASVLPVVSSCILSTYLFIVTERRRAASPSGGSKRKMNTMLFVFTTSAWTLVAMLPSRAYFTWVFAVYVHGARPSCPEDFVLWLGYSTNLLMTAYPILNPFIGLFLCAPYKREVASLLAQAKQTFLRIFQ